MAKLIQVEHHIGFNENVKYNHSVGLRNDIVKAKVKQSQIKKQAMKRANDIIQAKTVNFVQRGIILDAKNKARHERKLKYSK